MVHSMVLSMVRGTWYIPYKDYSYRYCTWYEYLVPGTYLYEYNYYTQALHHGIS